MAWLSVDFLRRPWFYRNLLVEFLGTFFLVSIQCAVVLHFDSPTTWIGLVQVGVTMGLMVICIIEMFGHFSGGHYNPAVTCGMIVGRKICPIRAIFYVVCQVAAAIVAAYFVKGVTPPAFRQTLSVTRLHPDVKPIYGMFIEAWLTALLAFTIFGATDGKRRRVVTPSIPIGFSVAVDIMAAASYTGASMNPARSLGPALAMDLWDDHWVYWAGPILGAVFASIVYNYILVKGGEEEQGNHSSESSQDEDKGRV